MIVGDGWAFIENPKTGSTSCAEWLGRHAEGRRPPADRWPRHSFPLAPMKRAYVIGVVRDPVDRLVSAWRRKHYSTPFSVWLRGEPHFYVGGVDILRTPQTTWLKYADRVLDHARLDVEWSQLCEDMGWDNTPLPRSNKAVEERPVISYNDRELIMDRFYPDYARWRFA